MRASGGRLAGKVTIVTGAGSRGEGIGIGRAIAITMAREGATVILVDNVPEWVATTASMIEAEGGKCHTFIGDVTNSADCEAVIGKTLSLSGRLDILVNNVGVSGPSGTAVDVDLDAWDRGLRTNVTSMMLMARFAIPAIAAIGGGAIVNIGSFAGLFGGIPKLLYPTSKGAIPNMTRAMAAHHAPQGIRVNCVAPGSVYTPKSVSRGMSAELREARMNRSLLRTEGTGWDVANAVLYLASDEARWVTGVTLPVDAGASAAPQTYPQGTV